MKIRAFPKGVGQYRDQHGKLRTRGRRKGATYYFKNYPGTDAFEEELRLWSAGTTEGPEVGNKRSPPGSISALIARYYKSTEFLQLSKSTQNTYKGIAERFRLEHGDRTVSQL